jgi:carbon starvation protein
VLIKGGKLRYAWVTALPLTWIAIVTTTAATQKIFSTDAKLGFFAGANALAEQLAAGALAPARAAAAPTLIFNQRLDGWLTVLFLILMWTVIIEMLRISLRYLTGKPVPPSSEAPYVKTQLDLTALPKSH